MGDLVAQMRLGMGLTEDGLNKTDLLRRESWGMEWLRTGRRRAVGMIG